MIFRSRFPDVEIPDVSLAEFILQRATAQPDKAALVDGLTGRTLTYGEMSRQIRTVAAGLAARGIAKGDVVAIYSYNRAEYLVTFYAAALAGAVTTTVNPTYTVEELVPQLCDSGAKALFTVPELVDRAFEAARQAGIEDVVVFGEAEGAAPFSELLATEGEPPDVAIDPAEDLVALPYSSGTTGLPKGVMLTHRNLVANAVQVIGAGVLTEQDTLLCVLPMFHIYGLSAISNCGLGLGLTIVVLPRFDLEQYLRTVERYRVTFLHVVPPIVLALAKHPIVSEFDLSAVRCVFSGAAPLGADLSRECAARLDCMVAQGYGMTETSPATHLTPAGRGEVRHGSIGFVVAETEVRLVDVDTGKDVDTNQRGEIWVRGPEVMKGYLNNPEATAFTIDGDGWLRTGDVAYVDEDGYFFVVDRVKELIKFKGFQIAPAELEALLVAHPAVADAAVIPSPDEEAGEVPKAFVVRRGEVTADELKEYIAGHVATYKQLREVEFVDQIPKSPSGKILRRVLIERDRAASA